MAQKQPQTLANHTRLDPPFHFFLAPVLLGNWLWVLYQTIRSPNPGSLRGLLLASALFVMGFLVRIYALKVQDRLIRLEERLRMREILRPEVYEKVLGLSEKQMVALRFASDAELPELVEQTLAGNLPPKEIKQRIRQWRPDHFRI